MKTAKSAGSPAFMPPELCVAKHGQVSGRAADIWSMGCTLYCLLFGRIPFEKHGMIELYQAIRLDEPEYGEGCNPEVKELLQKLLEKDPEKRITMDQLRVRKHHIVISTTLIVQEHPWVTQHGKDPLLPKSENVAVIIEPPTEEEVNAAITGNMGHLVTVVRSNQSNPLAGSWIKVLQPGQRLNPTTHLHFANSNPTKACHYATMHSVYQFSC